MDNRQAWAFVSAMVGIPCKFCVNSDENHDEDFVCKMCRPGIYAVNFKIKEEIRDSYTARLDAEENRVEKGW